jgi:hypothetical protein
LSFLLERQKQKPQIAFGESRRGRAGDECRGCGRAGGRVRGCGRRGQGIPAGDVGAPLIVHVDEKVAILVAGIGEGLQPF